MIVGGFILVGLGLKEVGGWGNLFDLAYPCSAPNNTGGGISEECLYPPDSWSHIIRPAGLKLSFLILIGWKTFLLTNL
jgi:hypothetical protein